MAHFAGTAAADTITGTAEADDIFGFDGDDLLDGGGGDDRFFPGGGNDRLTGGDGFDSVLMGEQTYLASSFTVDGQGNLVMSGPDGTDTMTGIEMVSFLDGRLLLPAADGPVGQVARLYLLALGHAPDAQGLDAWSARLAAGAPLADLAAAVIASPEFALRHGVAEDDAGFIDLLYLGLLGRAAEAGGAAYWQEQLEAGASRAEITAAFAETAEAHGLTAQALALGLWRTDPQAAMAVRLFDTLFGHPPGAQALALILAATGEGREDNGWLAEALLRSPDYLAGGVTYESDDIYVVSLYETALDRAPDAGGLAFWVAALAGGMSRAEVALLISESAEHVAQMAPWTEGGVYVG
jgi:hypothetical protein